MTTFFSVDFETTSTDVFKGRPLSVGIVAVSEWGDIENTLYCTIKYDETIVDDQATLDWWKEQNDVAYRHAWEGYSTRQSKLEVCNLITEFVGEFEEDLMNRIFVANPVGFDQSFMQKMFHDMGMGYPFSYRALCLRSMQFGMRGGKFGQKRDSPNKPEIEHHALYDAFAQAQDLCDMLMEQQS